MDKLLLFVCVMIGRIRYATAAAAVYPRSPAVHPLSPAVHAYLLLCTSSYLQGSATSKHSLMDLRLYMETPWPDAGAPVSQPKPNDILMFLKYYDPLKEELRFCGHMYVDKTLMVGRGLGLVGVMLKGHGGRQGRTKPCMKNTYGLGCLQSLGSVVVWREVGASAAEGRGVWHDVRPVAGQTIQ